MGSLMAFASHTWSLSYSSWLKKYTHFRKNSGITSPQDFFLKQVDLWPVTQEFIIIDG